MNKILSYLTISFILVLVYRCTYDRSLIYSQNYKIGNNEKFNLIGYYSDNSLITTNSGKKAFFQPIFFYEDGSVIYMGNFKDSSELRKGIIDNPKLVWGYWGNYQINNDTILIETIGSYGGSFHHERNTQVGVIKKDTILLIQNVGRTGNLELIFDTLVYSNFDVKPDSTSNWIRSKPKLSKRHDSKTK